MATKNLKSLIFPELDNTYVVPQVDATLSIEGRPADAKAVGDALEDKADLTDLDVKADKNGDVAIAERLYGGKYTENSEPYFFRPVPVDMAGSVEECIVGGSLAWNQLVDSSRFISATSGDVTATPNDDGSITITVANDLSADKAIQLTANTGTSYFRVPVGHKFVIYDDNPQFSNCDYREEYSGTSLGWNTIKTKATNNAIFLCLKLFSGTPSGTYKIRPQIIDLTALFGSSTIADYIYSLEQATAGAGVAWVKKYCPKLFEYNEYDAGSIKSAEGLVSHDTVGFNQWDEEWEEGTIDSTTGENISSSNYWRSKNYIPILPSTVYYVCSPLVSGKAIRARFYDADKNYIGYDPTPTTSSTFTTPNNARYMRFAPDKTVISSHDICINLSDPSRNGEYEPYKKRSYPLDSTVTLRGVPKLVNGALQFDGDIYPPSGNGSRRYGIVDLGTLNWTFYADWNGGPSFYTNDLQGVIKWGTGNNNPPNWMSTRYIVTGRQYLYEHIVNGLCPTGNDTSVQITIRDSNYTNASDLAAFKASLSGVYLVYELATPETFEAEPYQELQVVDSSGTEEYVSTGLVPVGHDSKYYEDVMKKVNGLPANFSTLIAPTEATYTATQNYSVGDYVIVDNVLYKVTSAISNGGTITPNTNVTATTIMAEILALA